MPVLGFGLQLAIGRLEDDLLMLSTLGEGLLTDGALGDDLEEPLGVMGMDLVEALGVLGVVLVEALCMLGMDLVEALGVLGVVLVEALGVLGVVLSGGLATPRLLKVLLLSRSRLDSC